MALVALSLIIKVSAICETIGFETAAQVKDASLHTGNTIYAVFLCNQIEDAVMQACDPLTDFQVTDVKYLYRGRNAYDLIGVSTRANFTVSNPIGIMGRIRYSQSLLARGFTGALQDASPLGEEAFHDGQRAVTVYVFPQYGKRFHQERCSVIDREAERGNAPQPMDREDAERKGFTPCLLCRPDAA